MKRGKNKKYENKKQPHPSAAGGVGDATQDIIKQVPWKNNFFLIPNYDIIIL